MAYSTYTTEAIVCGSRDRNTLDRSYLLFTRDGGMLYAEARAVRREHSKQRFALQDFSRVRISLIRGKAGWRVGSVEAQENFYAIASSREARGSVVRLVKLIRRLARGEEPMVAVYDFTRSVLAVLGGEVIDRPFAEAYIEVHLLALLGYVALPTLPPELQAYDSALLSTLASPAHRRLLEEQRAAAIAHSHL